MIEIKDVLNAQTAMRAANQHYENVCEQYFTQVLNDVGFSNKWVKTKDENGYVGQLIVKPSTIFLPVEYKFFMRKKDGTLSNRSTFLYCLVSLNLENAANILKAHFEIVNEGEL